MSYSRSAKTILNDLIFSRYTLPAAAIIGISAVSIFRRPPPQRVTMHHIPSDTNAAARFSSFDFLSKCLEANVERTAIFLASLHRQQLTDEQVRTAATLAVKNAHIVELDALAVKYPDVITHQFLIGQLLTTKNPVTFRELLEASAEQKLVKLNFLFDPTEKLTIVEMDDKKAYQAAARANLTRDKIIIQVDSEYYDPSFKMQVLPAQMKSQKPTISSSSLREEQGNNSVVRRHF